MLKAILEQGPVRKTRQVVMKRLDEESLLEGPPGRDVGQGA
jgi:hypothetical protein